MATYIGHVKEFNPDEMDWLVYKKKLVQFFLANDVKESVKKGAILLNSLSESAYELLTNLFMPEEPEGKDFNIIVGKLDGHYKSTKSIFAKRLLRISYLQVKHDHN